MLVGRPASGFTLTELMVVIVIISILAVMASPRDMMTGTRVSSAATDIHLSLVRARSEAIKRNENVTVTAVGGDWKSGWNTSFMIDAHGPVAGDNVAIAGNAVVTYTPNGRTTVNPVNISVTASESQAARCVKVSLSGQPTIVKEACP